MKQKLKSSGNEKLPSCLTGLALLLSVAPGCAVALSLMTYAIQAVFNRVPLLYSNYNMTYVFTAPIGVFVGIVAILVLWCARPNKFWLIVMVFGTLFVFFGVSIFLFNPITNPDDPSLLFCNPWRFVV